MTVLTVQHQERTETVQARAGATLREALEPTALPVRSGCNGNGSCGLCRVRILSGAVSAPTEQERLQLGTGLLDAGARLACQTAALGDLRLQVENLAPRTAWKRLPSGPPGPPMPAGAGLRAALDVGTTNLNLTLWDARGARLGTLRGLNPQGSFGSDVVTRLEAAGDPAAARQLAETVERAVAAALQELGGGGPCLVFAVGNTAMLALLRGSGAELLAPGSWEGPPRGPWEQPLSWRLRGQHEATVVLVPPLGGFVGSDLLAAAYAAGLLEGGSPALLIDFGTNTEIALWDGATLWVTSAAGGPAFEACGLRCGVPADDGAIFRVRPDSFEVIGGAEPRGVCGTGLVDWIACLVERGELSRRGNLQGGIPRLGRAGGGIQLHKRDVDLFQRAKAAIGAGIQVLQRQAGLGTRDLRRVITTGLFGRGLDLASAQAVGLLPAVPMDRIETHDNLALAGCAAMLASSRGVGSVDPLRARARMVNLGRCAEFEELFVQNLFLGPMEA